MIEVLTANFDQPFSGNRYKKKVDTQGEYFEYGILEYPRKTYGQIVNNLIAIQGRLTIKTNWDLDWQVREYIIDEDGKKWIISSIVKMAQEINPQVLSVMRKNPNTDYVISLIEVQNAEELK